MPRITPKNWREFQHYKDRSPPWIRLHRKLLDDKDFNRLSPSACKVLVLLWLVASDTPEGSFEDSPEDISFRLRMPEADVASALSELKDARFLIPAEEHQEESSTAPLASQIAEKNGFGSRHVSDRVKREVWDRDGGKCVLCGSSERIEFDHVHPVSKGGSSSASNVQLLCRTCNRKKRAKTAEHVATHAQVSLDMRTTETETEALQRTETETETETTQKSRASRSATPAKPDDVSDQVWADWCALRKAKKSTVSETVLKEARAEAAKAHLPLERFLSLWCARGSQGLIADWLKPHERGAPTMAPRDRIAAANAEANAEAARLLGFNFDPTDAQGVIDA